MASSNNTELLQSPNPLKIHQDQRVKVWWPADECCYQATVTKLTNDEVGLVYDNGVRQTYPRDLAILSRIMLGKVPKQAHECVLAFRFTLYEGGISDIIPGVNFV